MLWPVAAFSQKVITGQQGAFSPHALNTRGSQSCGWRTLDIPLNELRQLAEVSLPCGAKEVSYCHENTLHGCIWVHS